MNRAFKVRIYPNISQKIQINKTLGSCRKIYNLMLDERINVYEKLKDDKEKLHSYKYLTEKQYKEEFDFLKEADSKALQQANKDLMKAYQNFYSSLNGKRKGKSGFPKFKKRKLGSSYRTLGAIDVDFNNKKVKLPKLGWINYRNKRSSFKGELRSATVSRTSTGKYFVSLLFEQETKVNLPNIEQITNVKGLDMSLDKFFVDQDGNSPEYVKLYRDKESKLKVYQRRLSKKKKYSKNWYKAKHKVSLLHEQISNKRKDFLHKLSHKLVTENELIVVESLNLKGMTQGLKLGKSVHDLGYSEFVDQLNYKSVDQECLIIEADQWFASSKTCSGCGYKYSDLSLNERSWDCPECNEHHDRDTNAGKNLLNYGLKYLGLGQPDFKLVERV